MFLRKLSKAPIYISLMLVALPVILIIRLIRPFLLIRWDVLTSARIGHFAINTEMYLCMRDAKINIPNQPYIDIFWMPESLSNRQLVVMWKRILHIWPAWIMSAMTRVNRIFPGGAIHEVGTNIRSYSRDIYNLLDASLPHIDFTSKEIDLGESQLLNMSIKKPFVCLIVRDDAYLTNQSADNWGYHAYRDCDVQNYLLAAEELADRGYTVVRMGALVKQSFNSSHPKIIDYATNGMRSDFLDIYLGANCEFTISTGTGWDSVPNIFRRPIVYTNLLPFGYLVTFCKNDLIITRTHVNRKNGEQLNLTIKQIYEHGVAYCLSSHEYSNKHIELIENSPEEIRDVVIEMIERLDGTWLSVKDDEALQTRFWKLFDKNSIDVQGKPLHREIHARYGANYLRENKWWLE
jgi:putative glycosyltransferase (TIGR04372 family)